jgi:hypothetical protein
MDEGLLNELPAWLTEAGLAGASEADIVSQAACRMIAGGNWWRASEIVMPHLTRQPDAR